MTVNDRLRATTEAVAASMREVRPLELPPDTRPHRRRSTAPRSRVPGRWRGSGSWLVPLAAALAVIAVAVTLVSVRDASAPRPASPAPAPPVAVPSYYVAIQPGADSPPSLDDVYEVNQAVVGDARAGTVLATLKPPSGGTFDGVTGAAADRTFVLDVRSVPGQTGSQQVSYAWYLLRIAPGTADPVRLTRLPITDPLDDAVIHGLALSPDGRTLAVMFMPDMADGGTPGPITLRTYSLATGRPLRTWTGSQPDGLVCFTCNNTVELTWLADGHTLAFTYPESVLPQAIRTLDLTRPGDNLDADSHVIFPITSTDASDCVDPLLTPDGRTVLCGTTGGTLAKYGCATYGAQFDAYSTATGKLERVLFRYRGSCAHAGSDFVWAGSGTVAIGLLEEYTKGTSKQAHVIINGTSETTDSLPEWTVKLIFGVISQGKFTRLHVSMRDASTTVPASTPGLLAF
jgi:hypothetical protein